MGVNFDITERKQAEEAVAAAHRQVQSIIDNTTAIIYAFDLEERFLLANTALAELLNSTPEQMIGKRRHEFMPKEDADWHEANDRQVIEAGKALEFEEYSQLKGRSITWLTTKFPLRDAQGRIYAVAGISADVSERKKAEELPQQEPEEFYELIERSPFGMYIVDSQFRIAMMNASSQTDAFRNVRPVIGRDFTEAMRILWPEAVAAEIIGHFRHTLETGEPYYSRDFIKPRHDVEIVEAYEWELHRMTLPDGQYGVICYYYDSTKLREAEAALRESEGRFRALTENSSLAFGVSSSDGKFLYINKAYEKLFGCTQKELNHLDASELWCNPEDRRKMIDAVRSKGFLLDYEVELKRKDGTPFWAMLSVNSVDYGGNQAIMASVYDITERRRAEEGLKEKAKQLEDANKELEGFSYSVSHDLRAPLRAIDGYSRMILKKQEEQLDAETRQRLQMIKDSTEQMGLLIDDLLALSRFGSQAVTKKSLNMEELISEVWSELLAMHPDRKVTLKNGRMPVAWGDRSLMWQVYSNLLGNALKFTCGRECALIETGGFVQNSEIIYYVRDNGIGFDMKFSTSSSVPSSVSTVLRTLRELGWTRYCPAYHSPPRRPDLGEGEGG